MTPQKMFDIFKENFQYIADKVLRYKKHDDKSIEITFQNRRVLIFATNVDGTEWQLSDPRFYKGEKIDGKDS